jgi:hypothetical protein
MPSAESTFDIALSPLISVGLSEELENELRPPQQTRKTGLTFKAHCSHTQRRSSGRSNLFCFAHFNRCSQKTPLLYNDVAAHDEAVLREGINL